LVSYFGFYLGLIWLNLNLNLNILEFLFLNNFLICVVPVSSSKLPSNTYSNAESDKDLILQENQNKSGIYM
jgi:hypothetical protein